MNAHINLTVAQSPYPCDAASTSQREDESRRRELLDAIATEWIQLRATIDELEGRVN